MADILENLYRSRATVIEMMDGRGYNMDPYRVYSINEIRMAMDNEDLHMYVENSAGGHALIYYHIGKFSKSEIEKVMKEKTNEHSSTRLYPGDEIIFIVSDPVSENIEKATKTKMEGVFMQVFCLANLVVNYTKHVLVPRHRKVPEEEHAALLKSLHVASKTSMASIKYNDDVIGKFIGLKPGDIVEILRKSETAGEYLYYRHCVL